MEKSGGSSDSVSSKYFYSDGGFYGEKQTEYGVRASFERGHPSYGDTLTMEVVKLRLNGKVNIEAVTSKAERITGEDLSGRMANAESFIGLVLEADHRMLGDRKAIILDGLKKLLQSQ